MNSCIASPRAVSSKLVAAQPRRNAAQACQAYKVEVKGLNGQTTQLEVEEGDNILDAMIDAGLETEYDCKMGVCMTCPARVLSGSVDQAQGMLSEDVADQGYALLCVATPTSDCVVQEIEEAEILDVQLQT